MNWLREQWQQIARFLFFLLCIFFVFWGLWTITAPPTKYPTLEARQDLCHTYMKKAAPCIVARHPDVTDWCEVARGYTSDILQDCE